VTIVATPVVDRALKALRQAEAAAGVTISMVRDVEAVHQASEVWRKVWERTGDRPVPPEVLRALSHAGNYVGGAYRDGRMIGALLGFYAGQDGVDHAHSHILGVDPDARAGGVGFALKLHQRHWALERGLDRIDWTFDPLVRNNAFFNINKLGCRGVEYHVDFYGEMPDAINGGDRTDRILVEWRLASPEVEMAAAGGAAPAGADIGAWRERGAVVAIEVGAGEEPVLGDDGGDLLLVQVPEDIVALRHQDAAGGQRWRAAVRDVLGGALGRGLEIQGMSRDGWYVLSR
jgi:predicted GNAT superfamily acetyltransferase